MESYLQMTKVLLKHFGALAEVQTKRLKEASLATARRLERPIL